MSKKIRKYYVDYDEVYQMEWHDDPSSLLKEVLVDEEAEAYEGNDLYAFKEASEDLQAVLGDELSELREKADALDAEFDRLYAAQSYDEYVGIADAQGEMNEAGKDFT